MSNVAGENRTFEASNDLKSVRGELSVAWQIIAERDAFDAVAA